MAAKRAKGERSGKDPYGLALARRCASLRDRPRGVVSPARNHTDCLNPFHDEMTPIEALDALGMRRDGSPWHPQQVARDS